MPNPEILDPDKHYAFLQWVTGAAAFIATLLIALWKYYEKHNREADDDEALSKGESKKLVEMAARNAVLQAKLDDADLWRKIDRAILAVEEKAEIVAKANREMFYGRLAEVGSQLNKVEMAYKLIEQRLDAIQEDLATPRGPSRR